MKSRNDIKKMIESNSMQALDYLIEILDDNQKELFNLVIIQKRELKDLNEMKSLGTISYEENRLRLTKINVNILDIIDKLPDEFFQKVEKNDSKKNALPLDKGYILVSSLIRELQEIKIKEIETLNSMVQSSYNFKRHLIVNQTVRLIEKNNINVSSLEYMIIAEAFFRAIDNAKAEEYFKIAINNIDIYTDSAITKITIIRNYAEFLYRTNRPLDGAKQFEAAILENDRDEGNITNGFTYQMIFWNEAELRNLDKAVSAYQKAKAYYLKIGNLTAQNYNIKQLEMSWENRQIPLTYSRP